MSENQVYTFHVEHKEQNIRGLKPSKIKKQKYSYYSAIGFQYIFAEDTKEAETLIINVCGLHFIPQRLRKVEFFITE